METKLWWQSCKYTHIDGPTSRNFWLHSPLFFFFFSFFHFSFCTSLFFLCSLASISSLFFFSLPFRLSHLKPIKKNQETNFSFFVLRCKHQFFLSFFLSFLPFRLSHLRTIKKKSWNKLFFFVLHCKHHDEGDSAAGTRRRDGWSSPGDEWWRSTRELLLFLWVRVCALGE